jgi:hypothetical protein
MIIFISFEMKNNLLVILGIQIKIKQNDHFTLLESSPFQMKWTNHIRIVSINS